jgi:hypothetical protein
VGQGGVLVHAHNGREREPLGSGLAEQAFDLPGGLGLGHAGNEDIGQGAHDVVVQSAGGAQKTDLGWLLDAAQVFDQAGAGRQGEVFAQGLVVEDIDRARVEAEGGDALALQHLGHGRVLTAAVDERVLHGPKPLGRVGEARVGHEQVAAGGQNDKPAHGLVALGVAKLEAGQVIAVGGVGHQERGNILLSHPGAQTFAPGGEYGGIGQLHW